MYAYELLREIKKVIKIAPFLDLEKVNKMKILEKIYKQFIVYPCKEEEKRNMDTQQTSVDIMTPKEKHQKKKGNHLTLTYPY